MSAKSIPPRHVLRGILRFLKTPTLSPHLQAKASTPLQTQSTVKKAASGRFNDQQTFVLQQYRERKERYAMMTSKPTTDAPLSSDFHNNNNNDKQKEQSLQNDWNELALDYWRLQKDLAERARLYELDTGAEVVFTPKEMSRRAAARAGLQMPIESHEDANGLDSSNDNNSNNSKP